eukprot:GEMP01043956.1.p1 GENE.GEMP01043956.1~~GEMP01043956.1.p1  ORF type:complete len:362 (+),score=59.15 GEMP01043956.1:146-1231(+)
MGKDAVHETEAICAVLYGDKYSLFVASLALGKQLTRHSSRKRYLLHDSAAVAYSDCKAALCRYWNLISIDRISSPESCYESSKSLEDVFTKLRMLEVFPDGTELLFLDLDILVESDIDVLFASPSPAGKFHGSMDDIPVDAPRPFPHGTTLETHVFQPYTCINAGVLRLRAGKEVFQRMMDEIEKRRGKNDLYHQSYLPEQYFFVSQDWFKKPWFLIDNKYNQEVDNRLLEAPLALLEESVITHFSCNNLKPWDYMGANACDIFRRWQGKEDAELSSCDFSLWLHQRFVEWGRVVDEVAVELKQYQVVTEAVDTLKARATWWNDRARMDPQYLTKRRKRNKSQQPSGTCTCKIADNVPILV